MRRLASGSVLLACALVPCAAVPVHAQLDGARVNWPLPKNMNVVGVHRIAGTANATLTNLHRVEPSLDLENELYMLTWSRSQPLLGRSTVFTVALPAGLVRTTTTAAGASSTAFVHGMGDPSLGVTMNLYGAPGLMLREYLRYDLRTVVTLGINATAPWGQYDSEQTLNIGGNRARLRLSLPVVQSLSDWVPGDRTTLEVVPSITLLADNDDRGGLTVEQDAMWAVESHLSRDVTRRAFLSLDHTWLRQGEARTLAPSGGPTLGTTPATEAHLLGATMGYQINDNLSLLLTHMQSLGSDTDAVELQGGLFRMTFNWAFHRVIERRRALGGGD